MQRCHVYAQLHRERECERERERVYQEARNRYAQEVEELKRAQDWRTDEFSRPDLRESQFTVDEFTAQIQELQNKMNSTNNSRELRDVESACSWRLSHVPNQPVIVPSPCGMLTRDYCQRPDTRNLLGTSGNVFENSSGPVASTTPIYRGMLRGRNPITTFDGSVFSSTGKPVARREEGNKNAILITEIRQEIVNLESSISCRWSLSAKLYG